jgi:hypothetical protein
LNFVVVLAQYVPPEATSCSTVCLIESLSWSDQANLLIFKYYRYNSRCFEALNYHFRALKRTYMVLETILVLSAA